MRLSMPSRLECRAVCSSFRARVSQRPSSVVHTNTLNRRLLPQCSVLTRPTTLSLSDSPAFRTLNGGTPVPAISKQLLTGKGRLQIVICPIPNRSQKHGNITCRAPNHKRHIWESILVRLASRSRPTSASEVAQQKLKFSPDSSKANASTPSEAVTHK